jgi:hypothetical protein
MERRRRQVAQVSTCRHGSPLSPEPRCNPRGPVILNFNLTRVVGDDLVQVMSWYDNGWGYAAQMVRTARHVVGLPSRPVPEAVRAHG